jgi:hypothetical protein
VMNVNCRSTPADKIMTTSHDSLDEHPAATKILSRYSHARIGGEWEGSKA